MSTPPASPSGCEAVSTGVYAGQSDPWPLERILFSISDKLHRSWREDGFEALSLRFPGTLGGLSSQRHNQNTQEVLA